MNPIYNQPLELNTIKINADIYNKKFAKQDGNNFQRSIKVIGKSIGNPLNLSEVEESQNDIISAIKDIQSSLKEGQYVGIIYAPYQQEHVESFIVSKDNLFITAPHNLNHKLKKKIELNFPSNTRISMNTSDSIKNTKTGFFETRAIQSDEISCGAIALKTLKTLLSRKENGQILIESLPIQRGNSINMPPDILKISQSQKLIDKKTQNTPQEELIFS